MFLSQSNTVKPFVIGIILFSLFVNWKNLRGHEITSTGVAFKQCTITLKIWKFVKLKGIEMVHIEKCKH
jgi:hypothetical protein